MRDQGIEQPVSEIGVQPDGVVDHEKREETRHRNAAVMDQFVDGLPEHERGDAPRFQDGALSLTAEPCR